MGWFRSTGDADEAQAPTMEERLATITPGVPGRCPACDGLGYIDSIDIAHRYQIQHCKDCQHRWEYLFDQDGAVVGLTELDESGQPMARTRVRPLRATPAPPADSEVADPVESVDEIDVTDDIDLTGDIEPIDPIDDIEPIDDIDDIEPIEPIDPIDEVEPVDEVLDLRDPVVAPADEMSPAEWLRHSIRR